MSNETKRDVFDKLLSEYVDDERRIDGLVYEPDQHIPELDREYFINSYAAALPDDLPVIPKEVSEYIRKTTAPGKNGLIEVFCSLADDIRAVGHDNIYKWELWMLNNQAAVARAWLLGVWIVEETGEIVKLEAEK